MEAYSRDLMRGTDGGDDGEHKETMDLTLGLPLRAGDRFDYGAERRSGSGEGVLVGRADPGGGASATLLPQGSGNSIKEEPAAQGTPSAQGRSLSSAIVSSSHGTNGVHQAEGANNTVMATTSSPAPAVRAAALGSGGGQQDDSEMSKVREMPLVSTNGLPNGGRIVGLLYEYSKVDEVTILCMCHGSFLTPAEFVEHAGGGQVANPLRSIFVAPRPWL